MFEIIKNVFSNLLFFFLHLSSPGSFPKPLTQKQEAELLEKFKNENIVVKFIGDISKFSFDIQNLVKTIETETANKTGLHLNIAMNYGSRQEIINCTKKITYL